MVQGVLDGLLVVEVPGNPATGFCGKLFADFGARVVKVAVVGEEGRGYEESAGLAPFLDVDKHLLRPGDREAVGAFAKAAVIIGTPEAAGAAASPARREASVAGSRVTAATSTRRSRTWP